MTTLTGTLRLTRLAARRDRWVLPAWIVGIALFVAATTAMFESSLATREALVQETRLVATNAGMRMLGLTSGPTVGGYMLHREFVMLAVLAALMSTLTVVRHTRQAEELGRAEVLGSTVVGRHAPLAAAVAVAVAADLALAVAVGTAIWAVGEPVAGASLAGASVAAVGLVFVGVSAVTAQLTSTTRSATGISAAVLGLSFVLSGTGNMLGSVDEAGLRVTSAWPVWLSPIGWGQQTRPFSDGSWWPLLPVPLVLAALLVLAAWLVARRDVGRGLWREKRGAVRASRSLRSSPGLAWRLQRGAFLGWLTGLAAFGVLFGTLTEQIRDVEGPAREFYLSMGGTDSVVDAYRASMMQMAGMFVAIYVVQVLQRMRVDETGGTLEPVLAAAVSRTRWLAGHVLVSGTGALLLLVAFAVPMGVAAGQVLGDPGEQVTELVGAALAQLPGVLVLGATVVVVTAVAPHWAAPVSWSLLVVTIVLGPMFGPSLDLPGWVQDLSPFTHAPQAPAVPVSAVPLLALMGVAAVLLVVAVLNLRRRSLVLPA